MRLCGFSLIIYINTHKTSGLDLVENEWENEKNEFFFSLCLSKKLK